MVRLKQDFKSRYAVPAAWFNTVASILNHLVGKNGICVDLRADPSVAKPCTIGLDADQIKQMTAGETGSYTGEVIAFAGTDESSGAYAELLTRKLTVKNGLIMSVGDEEGSGIFIEL